MDDDSLHDHILLGYGVDSAERRITLETLSDRKCRVDAVFSGVLAYHFEGDTFRTILFDVLEVSLERIIADHRDVFARRKSYGWPVLVYGSDDELLATLREYDICAYQIQSSYGLDGFVLATSLTLRKVV